jgi:hypothetical protein
LPVDSEINKDSDAEEFSEYAVGWATRGIDVELVEEFLARAPAKA